MLSAEKTRHTDHISDLRDDAREMYSHMNSQADDLVKKQKVKAAIVHYAKTGKWKKPYPKCTISIDSEGMLTGFKIDRQPYQKYVYKLDADIRKLKASISNIKNGAERREADAARLEKLPPKRTIFGSRKLYRQKDTVGLTRQWREKFDFARHNAVTISGRKDVSSANCLVKLRCAAGSRSLVWTLPGSGNEIILPDFTVARYQNEYLSAVDKLRDPVPVAYTFELHKDGNGRTFLLVKVTFELPEIRVNDSVIDGVIAMDTNADRLAWSNLSADGRLLEHGVIRMDLEGKSSGQRKLVIGMAVKQLGDICARAKKPLVIESLDTLTEREQKVLRMRFGLDTGSPMTLEEVGREFNVTRERIRQIEAKSLRKLRARSRAMKLVDWIK